MSRAGSNEHVFEAVQRRLDEHPVDAKRSDQSTAETPCREGAVHITRLELMQSRAEKALGLAVPPSILARADEVIE
jgi:hypothetical protein